MRFAYIDSQGKEVPIPTVDALRLRIALKAIVDDTMFFDASSDRWASAREHEIYRTLTRELAEEEEPGFVAPPPAAPAAFEGPGVELEVDEDGAGADAGTDETSDGEEWRFAISNSPSDEPSRSPGVAEPPPPADAPDAPDGLEPPDGIEPLDGLEDIHVVAFDTSDEQDADEGQAQGSGRTPESQPTGSAAGSEDEPSRNPLGAGQGPIGSSSWVDLDMEGEEDASFDLDGVDLSDPPEPPSGGRLELVPEMGGPAPAEPDDPAPLEGLQQDRHDFTGLVEEAGWGDEPPPTDLDVEPTSMDADADVAPAAPPRAQRDVEPPLPSREGLARRSGGQRSGAPPPSGAAPSRPARPTGPPRRPARRSGGRGAGVIASVVVLGLGAAGAAWWFVGRAAGEAEGSDPLPEVAVEIPEVPAALQEHVAALGPQVRAATFEALRALPTETGLPVEPPTRWLAGDYLANASRFDDVPAYWSAMDRFLRLMQATEDSLFTGTLGEQVAAASLAPEDAEQVQARILAGFRATAPERGAVYQQARAVGEAAIRLHNFLRDNEADITYEPGVSSDPVLEAIPATPELGEDMWDRVGDITEAMDALDFLDRVTTDRFVDAVIRRLEAIPLR